jgi:hypothetical protein
VYFGGIRRVRLNGRVETWSGVEWSGDVVFNFFLRKPRSVSDTARSSLEPVWLGMFSSPITFLLRQFFNLF